MTIKIHRFKMPKISIYDFASFFILLCCIDIPYLNMQIPYLWLLSYVRYFIVVLLLLISLGLRKRLSFIVLINSILFGIILYSTYRSNNDVMLAVDLVTRPYLICLYLDLYKTKKDRILNVWCLFLFFLVLLDTLSMLGWRQGLYATAMYKENWFLGYKTQRMVYSLPLCIFSGYLSHSNKDKTGKLTYLMVLLSAFGLFYSQATGALLSIILLGVLFLSFDFSDKINVPKRLLYGLFNYKIVLSLYGLAVFSVITIQRNRWIQDFVVNYLGKNANLTGRTDIWKYCFRLFETSPVIGVGHMSGEQYIAFTHNIYATNAHNMVFTLLLSAGIVGLVLYALNYIHVTRGKNKEHSNTDLILIAGIIVLFFIGITSSTLVFSVFGFVFYEIMALDQKGSERKRRYVWR